MKPAQYSAFALTVPWKLWCLKGNCMPLLVRQQSGDILLNSQCPLPLLSKEFLLEVIGYVSSLHRPAAVTCFIKETTHYFTSIFCTDNLFPCKPQNCADCHSCNIFYAEKNKLGPWNNSSPIVCWYFPTESMQQQSGRQWDGLAADWLSLLSLRAPEQQLLHASSHININVLQFQTQFAFS